MNSDDRESSLTPPSPPSAPQVVQREIQDFVRAHGVTPPQGKFVNDDADKFGPDEKNLMLRLTHALRFVNAAGETHDVPAGTDILMPREGVGGMADPYGGTFSILLSQYLQKRDADTYRRQLVAVEFPVGRRARIRLEEQAPAPARPGCGARVLKLEPGHEAPAHLPSILLARLAVEPRDQTTATEPPDWLSGTSDAAG